MKLTEREIRRVLILVEREINDDKVYVMDIESRIKELEEIQKKLKTELQRKERERSSKDDRKKEGKKIKETVTSRARNTV